MEMEETLLVVRDLAALERVREYLANPEFDFTAYDCETTGVEKDAEMIGYSIACEEPIGIYVVIAEWIPEINTTDCTECEAGFVNMGLTKQGAQKKPRKCKTCKGIGYFSQDVGYLKRYPEMKEASKAVFEELKKKRLIMHNGIFDVEVADREMGINLMDAFHTDTMPLAHLLNENESVGLKDIGERLYGDDAVAEKNMMRDSVRANGGIWQEKPGGIKEMYKADSELMGRYGAKDTLLTMRVFYHYIPILFEEALDKFFYEDESMPLIKSATYELNTAGLRVDLNRLKEVEAELTEQCTRLKAEIEDMLMPHVSEKYPNGFGAKKPGAFNINSPNQLAWLLFEKLGKRFLSLTPGGKKFAKDVLGKVPYSDKDKRRFMQEAKDMGKDPWKFLKADKDALAQYVEDFTWCKKLLEFRQAGKMLKTYIGGIKKKVKYGIIHPSFLQCGTTSGRYSSNSPNFQNLPRDDKRIKSIIVSRPGRVFIGADYSQLEPRVFASVSQDEKLMATFANGWDFYSVIGAEIYADDVTQWECNTGKKIGLKKKDENYFGKIFEDFRQVSKAFCLATPYGTSAFQQAQKLKRKQDECQNIIDTYFGKFPSVQDMMLDSHQMAMNDGVVYNLYGRPRRIPDATKIRRVYGDKDHGDLPYEARTLLNLGMNHRVQSTAASIVNRSAIAFCKRMKELNYDAKIVLQVHDEINVECREDQAEEIAAILKACMETTCTLPGVLLQAEPKIARSLADLK